MTLYTISPFFAQAEPSAVGGGINMVVVLLMLAGFWFLIIAPQRKRQKAHEKMLAALETGDEVLTAGGLYGTIAQIKNDRLVLKVADGVKLEFNRSAIQSKISPEKDAK